LDAAQIKSIEMINLKNAICRSRPKYMQQMQAGTKQKPA